MQTITTLSDWNVAETTGLPSYMLEGFVSDAFNKCIWIPDLVRSQIIRFDLVNSASSVFTATWVKRTHALYCGGQDKFFAPVTGLSTVLQLDRNFEVTRDISIRCVSNSQMGHMSGLPSGGFVVSIITDIGFEVASYTEDGDESWRWSSPLIPSNIRSSSYLMLASSNNKVLVVIQTDKLDAYILDLKGTVLEHLSLLNVNYKVSTYSDSQKSARVLCLRDVACGPVDDSFLLLSSHPDYKLPLFFYSFAKGVEVYELPARLSRIGMYDSNKLIGCSAVASNTVSQLMLLSAPVWTS